MELLHERLREWASEASISESPIVNASIKLCALGHFGNHRESDVFNAIADKIERDYIPRPRFEDGEPVQWGDEYQADSGKTATLTQMFVRHTGKVVLGRQGKRAELPEGTFVKRPTPKVLDADGVPYQSNGDTVWHIKSGNKFDVRCLDPFEVVGFGGVSSTWFKPEEFTHREPDSLEKLRDDMKKAGLTFDAASAHIGEHCNATKWADRLTALIERGA